MASPRAPRALAALLLILLVAAAFSGCLAPRRYGGAAPSAALRDYHPAPNFVGDWAVVDGNYSLYRLEVRLERFNKTSNEYIAAPVQCNEMFTYRLDEANRTLRVSSFRPLHPLDPGRLRVLFLLDLVESPGCHVRAPFAINDNAPIPSGCGLPGGDYNRTGAAPWTCNLPVDNFGKDPFLWVNVTFTFNAAAPGGFWVDANGERHAATQRFNLTVEGDYPPAPQIHEWARATLQPLGDWPFSSIRR